jgi:hypothetical protein
MDSAINQLLEVLLKAKERFATSDVVSQLPHWETLINQAYLQESPALIAVLKESLQSGDEHRSRMHINDLLNQARMAQLIFRLTGVHQLLSKSQTPEEENYSSRA